MFVSRPAVPLACGILVNLLATAALAQPQTGTITGVVRDVLGAVVPGAAVTITRQETGAAREVRSGPDGTYSVPNLRPGLYTVSADFPGFGRAAQRGVRVAAAASAAVDLTV